MISYYVFKKTNIVYQFVCFYTLAFVFFERQYFRFGDVNVSSKACKVFATFQFLSICCEDTKNEVFLSLFRWSAFVYVNTAELIHWRDCFIRWSVCVFHISCSTENSKPGRREVTRYWSRCWNYPLWNQQGTFWLCFLYKGILNKI